MFTGITGVTEVPQTDLSVGVLTVLYQGGLGKCGDSAEAAGEQIHCYN